MGTNWTKGFVIEIGYWRLVLWTGRSRPNWAPLRTEHMRELLRAVSA